MTNKKSMIEVFPAEVTAGIGELVRASGAIAYCSQAYVSSDHRLTETAVAEIAAPAEVAAIDLHYLKSLLATTTWNANDDVFLAESTWAARATAEDKPFNYGHVCNDIIGHITSSYAVDDEGAAIADTTAVDELPSKFHIVTGAVLYKEWADDALQERMDRILAEIAEGKWFVSMECLLCGFDYAMKGDDGVCEIVTRDKATAFLTKHLRAYGGKGVFDGRKLGRVLRNFVFSGKGLVAKPANPESIIFSNDADVLWSGGTETAAATVVERARASQSSQLSRDIARFFARP